jgi:2,3-bisphosphoglycerate-independent phosphoglycerate mutase
MTTENVSVLLFFIDGLGIGTRGSANPLDGLDDVAPFALFRGEQFRTIHDGVVVATDACLGVPGRPQSASGQTTILTGVNAPALLGYHKQGFPNGPLLEILGQHSVFLQLVRAGIAPLTFANAYTKRFFQERPRWVSATTAAVQAAGLSFRTIDDVRNNLAVYQDFTNAILIEQGENVATRTAAEAAAVLARIVKENRFTLYEYFITDKIGHAQDMRAAKAVLQNLSRFVRELLDQLDLDQTSVILTSDHGNIEDLSSRNHTLNAVPTIVWGAKRKTIAPRIINLSDITPVVIDTLTKSAKAH